ncbi:hypothetical protein PLESTB_000096900 [Pleodorina starrii]|uniref:RING-type domain-containing protein n=1 Tax=Pleodorina starrii TaxID=330485 RepID=A0A9W6BA68_9CHLO|nr:hypothetical protein PLESTB_000096900 [Pleodorina starrii]GLC71750.1 hypothetical protein PLESTF_001162600 [Pleodorina starrii]
MSVTTRITDDDVGRGGGRGALLPLGLSPDDVNCPICVETITDPFVTSCGHTFCYQCISTQLKHKNSCPSCGDYLTADNIYPNFLLNKILRKAATAPPSGRGSLLDQVQRLLADNMAPEPPAAGPVGLLHLHHHNHNQQHHILNPHQQQLGHNHSAATGHLPAASGAPAASRWPARFAAAAAGGGGSGSRLRLRDIDAVLEALYEAREELERRESSDVLHLLLCFLQHAREHKERKMAELRQQLTCLEYDILSVTASAAATAAAATAAAVAAGEGKGEGAAAGGGGGGAAAAGPSRMEEVRVLGGVAANAAAAAGPGSSSSQPPQPAGAWLWRALPHLHSDSAAAASGGDANEPPPAALPEQQQQQHRLRDGAGPGPSSQQQAREREREREEGQRRRQRLAAQRAPPLRRSSWCLHTITPGGGISSVTVDTSNLLEPGQQAEAFGAAVQHALAAARGGGGGSSGGGGAADDSAGGERRRGLPPAPPGLEVEMDSVGQPPPPLLPPPVADADASTAAAASVGHGARAPAAGVAVAAAAAAATAVAAAERQDSVSGAAATAAAAASAASGPAGSDVEASAEGASGVEVGGGGGGGHRHWNGGEPREGGAAAAVAAGRRGMPRCGSADNFRLLLGQAAAAAAPAAAPAGSQPAASGDAGTSAGGGGGEDGSALSGAAFPPPDTAAGGDAARRHPQPCTTVVRHGDDGARHGLPAGGAATLGSRALVVAAAVLPQRQVPGGGGGGGSGDATRRPARGRAEEEESEDEMDVRERRRGRGRLQPPPQPHQQQQPGAWAAAAAAATAATDPRVGAAPTANGGRARRGREEEGEGAGAEVEAEGDPAAVQEAKRRRMVSQFDLLERCYLQMRATRTSGTGLSPLPHQPPLPVSSPSPFSTAVAAAAAAAAATAATTAAAASTARSGSGFRTEELAGRPVGHRDPHIFAGNGIAWDPSVAAAPPLGLAGALHLTGSGGGGAAAAGTAPCGGAHPHRGPSGPDGLCNCESGDHGGGGNPDLETFGAVLAAATQYSRLELLAEIPRHGSGSGSGSGSRALAAGPSSGMQILSSIEFDLSDDLFATAGAVPRILVYDYQSLLQPRQRQRPPRPVTELTARSRLSCLSYSRGVRQHLLAADYQGGVALWDTEAGMQVQDYEAHERRVWGLDFCPAPGNTHCFASGSDDGLVKVWTTRQSGSSSSSCCLALELRGNVCSVQFHPTDPNLLAVGSALHCAAVYDLRQPAAPLHTLLGHRRAVSYVRWLSNGQELVTASTDGTLKLWSLAPTHPPPIHRNPTPAFGADANQTTKTTPPLTTDFPGGASGAAAGGAGAAGAFRGAQLVRTFSGHVNERNFVGLCSEGDYLACGSESHEVYVYHRSLPQPALRFDFGPRMLELEPEAAGHHPHHQPHHPQQPHPPHHFVTALQWRRNSPHLLAANSAGYVWLLGLRL